MRAFAPNGSPILGTLERLSARAEIAENSFRREPDGSVGFEWQGSTEIFYDDQVTEERDGKAVYLAQDGTDWTEDQIELREDEDEAADSR